MVAQRQPAQHGRTIARQADRQPAGDQLDLSHGLAPEGGLGGDKVAGELAEQEARLAQRRRDYDRKTALQYRPGGLEGGHSAAALPCRIEEQPR
jgi:hypothetical protein